MIQASSELSPTRAIIDLDALRRNLGLLRDRAPEVGIIGVVKANAYGHGAVEISRTLEMERIDGLAVATLPEAVQLREAGVTSPLMVFGAPRPQSIHAYSEYDIEAFVTSVDALTVIRQAGRLRVHLHIDTGMGRLGVQPEDVSRAVSLIDGMTGIELAGISTHLAAAGDPIGDFSRKQWDLFTSILNTFSSVPAPVHLASSGAFFTVPESVDPSMIDYARPGIGLYGLLDIPGLDDETSFAPVMTLVSEVAQVKTVPADTPISYDGRWRAPRRTRIATVAAGYADGYPRNLTNKGAVGINGSSFPVVGTVCMDLFMVDLGPADEHSEVIRRGDPVVLFGNGGPSAVSVARIAETIPYELVCRVAPRVERIYMNSSDGG